MAPTAAISTQNQHISLFSQYLQWPFSIYPQCQSPQIQVPLSDCGQSLLESIHCVVIHTERHISTHSHTMAERERIKERKTDAKRLKGVTLRNLKSNWIANIQRG